MKINRRGTTRIVLEFKKVVVKIPDFTYQWSSFLKGIIANIEENEIWKYSSLFETDKSHLLCPVKWCSFGGWILVMEKAEQLNYSESKKYNFEEHLRYFKGDDSHQNYGILNGKLVKLIMQNWILYIYE
jgi:hypothetical protein